MKRTRSSFFELLLSVLLHAAILAAFGAPVALEELADANEKPSGRDAPARTQSGERPARREAARRLERELPRVRPEVPPQQQRKLVILPAGSGLADHDARATGGMPGIVRPSGAQGPQGKLVKLPAFEPEQLENPKTSEMLSARKDLERSPLQRPELDPGLGLFASLVSQGRLQPDPGRPSAAAAQAQASTQVAAATPVAAPTAPTPSSAAMPPPPSAELAKNLQSTQREEPEAHAAPVRDREAPQGVAEPIQPKSTETKEVRVERASSPFERRSPRLAMVVTAAQQLESRPLERPDRSTKAEQPKKDEPKPEERLAQKGQEEAEEKKVEPEAEPKPAEERQSPPKEEEDASASSQSKDSGLWVSEGKAQQKREESGEEEATPKPLAEGKAQEQPLQLAMAATPRAPGAGDEQSRKAQMASEFAPSPKSALTSFEQTLQVDSLEGGEEGARRLDRSGRTLAASERALVGLETVEGHQQGEPNAGRILVAPEGDGSGDEEAMASVAGRAELRHLVQDRINYVAGLLGPRLVERTGRRGIAIVKFKVDFRGYVRAVKLERSTGSPELDQEIEPVIRLAEPYTGWLGWMRVAVCFGAPAVEL